MPLAPATWFGVPRGIATLAGAAFGHLLGRRYKRRSAQWKALTAIARAEGALWWPYAASACSPRRGCGPGELWIPDPRKK